MDISVFVTQLLSRELFLNLKPSQWTLNLQDMTPGLWSRTLMPLETHTSFKSKVSGMTENSFFDYRSVQFHTKNPTFAFYRKYSACSQTHRMRVHVYFLFPYVARTFVRMRQTWRLQCIGHQTAFGWLSWEVCVSWRQSFNFLFPDVSWPKWTLDRVAQVTEHQTKPFKSIWVRTINAWSSRLGAGLEILPFRIQVPLWPPTGFVSGSPCFKSSAIPVHSQLASVIRRLDGTVHCINHYPLDKCYQKVSSYPVDSDLSNG